MTTWREPAYPDIDWHDSYCMVAGEEWIATPGEGDDGNPEVFDSHGASVAEQERSGIPDSYGRYRSKSEQLPPFWKSTDK